ARSGCWRRRLDRLPPAVRRATSRLSTCGCEPLVSADHEEPTLALSRIEIARPAEEVFSNVTDPSRFVTWQANTLSGGIDEDHPPRVGSRCITTHKNCD